MLVPVRASVDLRQRTEQNNELYQLKVDVGLLNTVSLSSDEGLTLETSAQ